MMPGKGLLHRGHAGEKVRRRTPGPPKTLKKVEMYTEIRKENKK
jgi:hypothetical protein